jgi:hypothetical protein
MFLVVTDFCDSAETGLPTWNSSKDDEIKLRGPTISSSSSSTIMGRGLMLLPNSLTQAISMEWLVFSRGGSLSLVLINHEYHDRFMNHIRDTRSLTLDSITPFPMHMLSYTQHLHHLRLLHRRDTINDIDTRRDELIAIIRSNSSTMESIICDSPILPYSTSILPIIHTPQLLTDYRIFQVMTSLPRVTNIACHDRHDEDEYDPNADHAHHWSKSFDDLLRNAHHSKRLTSLIYEVTDVSENIMNCHLEFQGLASTLRELVFGIETIISIPLLDLIATLTNLTNLRLLLPDYGEVPHQSVTTSHHLAFSTMAALSGSLCRLHIGSLALIDDKYDTPEKRPIWNMPCLTLVELLDINGHLPRFIAPQLNDIALTWEDHPDYDNKRISHWMKDDTPKVTRVALGAKRNPITIFSHFGTQLRSIFARDFESPRAAVIDYQQVLACPSLIQLESITWSFRDNPSDLDNDISIDPSLVLIASLARWKRLKEFRVGNLEQKNDDHDNTDNNKKKRRGGRSGSGSGAGVFSLSSCAGILSLHQPTQRSHGKSPWIHESLECIRIATNVYPHEFVTHWRCSSLTHLVWSWDGLALTPSSSLLTSSLATFLHAAPLLRELILDVTISETNDAKVSSKPKKGYHQKDVSSNGPSGRGRSRTVANTSLKKDNATVGSIDPSSSSTITLDRLTYLSIHVSWLPILAPMLTRLPLLNDLRIECLRRHHLLSLVSSTPLLPFGLSHSTVSNNSSGGSNSKSVANDRRVALSFPESDVWKLPKSTSLSSSSQEVPIFGAIVVRATQKLLQSAVAVKSITIPVDGDRISDCYPLKAPTAAVTTTTTSLAIGTPPSLTPSSSPRLAFKEVVALRQLRNQCGINGDDLIIDGDLSMSL